MRDYVGWKYKIENEQHFKDLQKYLIDKGYEWTSSGRVILDFEHIFEQYGNTPYWLYVKKLSMKIVYRGYRGYEDTVHIYPDETYYELSFLDIIPKDMFEL